VIEVASTLAIAALAAVAGVGCAARSSFRGDPLAALVTALVWATGLPLAVALVLGFLGLLHISIAAAVLLTIAAFTLRRREHRAASRDLLASMGSRALSVVKKHPLFAILAAQSLGVEALRGLLRPPLSWDALAYHLLLPATWLRDLAISTPYGRHPVSFYSLFPGNGELWLWWSMAPSHSELFTNLAFLPHWLLLVAGTGLLARSLGAGSSWPIAAAVVGTLPVIVRAAATPYLDIFTSSLLVAAVALWSSLDAGRRISSTIGAALGIAAGAKVFGLLFAAATAAALVGVGLPPGRRGPRLAASTAAVFLLFGAPFYLRNVALGVGPLAAPCAVATETSPLPMPLAGPQTLAGSFADRLADGSLLETFLGRRVANSFELGIGPAAVLLLGTLLALGARALRDRRHLAIAVVVAAQLVVFATIPFVLQGHIYGHARYLDFATALLVAVGAAALDHRGPLATGLLGAAVVGQSLLLQSPALTTSMRLVLAALLVGLLLVPLWRRARRPVVLAGGLAAVLALLTLAPRWVAFRLHDRERAYTTEWALHDQPARFAAGAWGFLDREAGDRRVAAVSAPPNRFIVPAMGPRYEREVTYVNVQAPDIRFAPAYPNCAPPRTAPDRAAWLQNLVAAEIHYLLVTVDPGHETPIEATWAAESPELFVLRHRDQTSAVWELAGPLAEAVAARAESTQ
jgi:hypothetical protein